MGREHQEAHFQEFGPHTLLKHRILEGYLAAYIAKVALAPGASNRITLVDGFAGKGRDDAGHAGSPIIIARRVAEMRSTLAERFGKALIVETVLVEADLGQANELAERLKPFGTAIRIIQSRLADAIDGILVSAATDPFFVFLDPFGIRGVSHSVMSRILSYDRGELFVLIDQDGVDRLLRAATVSDTKANRRLVVQARKLDLFDNNEERLAEIKKKMTRSRSALAWTAAGAVEHLTMAFGSEDPWKRIALIEDATERRREIVQFFEGELRRVGSTYVTSIPILKPAGDAAYTLIHASHKPSGREIMKECVQTAFNKAGELGFGGDVISEMKRTMGVNPAIAVELVQRRFGGQTTEWTESIRPFLLRETRLCPWQMDEVKALLGGINWRVPGQRKLIYKVPTPV